MRRRLKEHRHQRYGQLNCPCWMDRKAMALLKEQPKRNRRCYPVLTDSPNPWPYVGGRVKRTPSEALAMVGS
jgi:hypothetical protein